MTIIQGYADGHTDVVRARGKGKADVVRAEYQQKINALEAECAELLPRSAEPGTEVLDVYVHDRNVELQFAQTAQQRQALKRRANVMAVVAEAADEMPDEVSEQPVDDDWTARFFSGVQDVSEPQLQKLWGKLLSGEITEPGSVSLRTLEMLKNLTKTEAEGLRQLAARTNMWAAYIPATGDELGVGLGMLRDAGIIEDTDVHLPWMKEDVVSEGRPTGFESGSALIQFPNHYSVKVRTSGTVYIVPMYVLRPRALTILNAIRVSTNVEYIFSLARTLEKKRFITKVEVFGPGTDVPISHDATSSRNPEGWAGQEESEERQD